MKECSKEVIEALDGSIEKWYNITFGGAQDRGYIDCPLCNLFLIHRGCKGCPINYETGDNGCEGTPYDDFPHLERVTDRKSAEAAYAFYTWLKDLRSRICEEKQETYKVGDVFEGDPFGGIYLLTSLEQPDRVMLVRLNYPNSGGRCADSQQVTNKKAITKSELDKLSGGINVKKIEGKINITKKEETNHALNTITKR